MSELHPSDRKALLRAGFTEREIATQKRKFYNLTQINPCYTDELKQFEQLQADRRVLLDALENVMYWDNGKSEWEIARAVLAQVKGAA